MRYLSRRTIAVGILLFFFQCSIQAQSRKALEERIDSVVSSSIDLKVFPGCVVYAAQNGKQIFLKEYGHHTYEGKIKTKKESIYDLASITKVTAATLALMKLYEEKKFELDDPIGDYLDGLNWSLSKLTFRELLAHQSGLPPGIRFQDKIKEDDKYIDKTLSYVKNLDYNYRIGRSLYAFHDLYPIMRELINDVEVSKEKKYVYSGLFFYLAPELITKLSGENYESYLYNQFYTPMGAKTLRFNAGRKFEDYEIAPTEVDAEFRMELIHGKVHDEGAALMRGVSGHAGLFGNATDLARVWQMFLNDGVFEGNRYLNSQTINLFTSVQFPNNENHRGLGFDKPFEEYNTELSKMAESASIRSYGHSGFTGTFVWADPDNDLLFIFLSNRVHPKRDPNQLKDLRIRQSIHQYFYEFLD